MKEILLAMAGFYFVLFWISPLFWGLLFPGNSVEASNLKPIYMGMVLLSGLIVGCSIWVVEEVRELKKGQKQAEPQNEG